MAREVHEVVFYSYPKLLFAWPLILLGVLFYPLAHWELVSEVVLGWIYVIVLTTVILTMGIDVNREAAVFWIITLTAIAFGSAWLEAKGYDFARPLTAALSYIEPRYSAGAGLAVSVFLAVPYAVMLFWARINDKWRFTHNEFEHYSLGKVDKSFARGAKTVRTAYPDLFEFILALAGEVIIADSRGERILARIPHVPMLPFVRAKIQRLLEVKAVTADWVEAEEEDEGEQDL